MFLGSLELEHIMEFLWWTSGWIWTFGILYRATYYFLWIECSRLQFYAYTWKEMMSLF